MIIDAHLDLAYNGVRGRDLEIPAARQPADAEGQASVAFPDLGAGGVGLVCGTIFCEPGSDRYPQGYHSPAEAREQALRQLQWYQRQEIVGALRLVQAPDQLPREQRTGQPLAVILLMEGADPLRNPTDVAEWFAAGLRIVGLAWRGTRYAGGSGQPGPLTQEGVALVAELDRFGIVHDVSHLAEEAFWQLLDLSAGPVIASHSNCRAIIPTDRQLSDAMIRAIAERGGVIGVNFYDRFLLPAAQQGTRRATLAEVVAQVKRICDVTGGCRCVGLGTDMDGGFGAEHLPVEIRTSADLPRVAAALADGGFTDPQIQDILCGNWAWFFRRRLAGRR